MRVLGYLSNFLDASTYGDIWDATVVEVIKSFVAVEVVIGEHELDFVKHVHVWRQLHLLHFKVTIENWFQNYRSPQKINILKHLIHVSPKDA